MSAFSTVQITKTAARNYLLGRVMMANDSELEELLDSFLSEHLYTAQIVSDDTVPNDNERLR